MGLLPSPIFGGSTGSGGDPGDWATITNKPSTFPPSSHSHPISDVTALQAALDAKAGTSHSHIMDDITGLDSALAGKANSSHTQAISTITGLQAELDAKAALSHAHSAADITSGLLALARGGLGIGLTDPNADRVLFWDDSAGQMAWLTMGTGLSITGTTLESTGGGATTLR